MESFIKLYEQLACTKAPTQKLRATIGYLQGADAAEAACLLEMCFGRLPKRIITARVLVEWAIQYTQYPMWLLTESNQQIDDWVETVSYLLPDAPTYYPFRLVEWAQSLIPTLAQLSPAEQQVSIFSIWENCTQTQRLIFNKLITGTFQLAITKPILLRALGVVTGQTEGWLNAQLQNDWQPQEHFYKRLFRNKTVSQEIKPIPFGVPQVLEQENVANFNTQDWQIEYLWQGIRIQIVQNQGYCTVWSAQNETLTTFFPEVEQLNLPAGTLIEAMVLPGIPEEAAPLSLLTQRLSRKKINTKVLQELPIHFVLYDILTANYTDLRNENLAKRLTYLEQLFNNLPNKKWVILSPRIELKTAEDWNLLFTQKNRPNTQGLIIKNLFSTYPSTPSQPIDWYQRKQKPKSIFAVLLYAKRSENTSPSPSPFSEFTFAIWEDFQAKSLIPIVRLAPDLPPALLTQIVEYIRANTIEKFGPVHSINPELIFEINFENIEHSKRNKSGLLLQNAKLIKYCTNKKLADIAHLIELTQL